MHTKLPFTTALILVLAPSAACLLLVVLYQLHFRRRNSKECEDLHTPIARAPHRRDDFQSILLVLGIATLAFAVSMSA